MTLEEYALGQADQDEPYGWWLEWNTPDLGSISGGSAMKHLIFKPRKRDGWYFPSQYDNEQEAWVEIRDAFVRAFELAGEGDFEAIEEIEELQSGAAVLSKSLTVYFPDKKLPIHSKTHLRHYLDKLGHGEDYSRADGTIRLNALLHKTLRDVPGLKDWHPLELAYLLYRWADPRKSSRVVKIAPGENARFWDDCLKNGYMRVGWEEVGDLQEFTSKKDFETEFEQTFFEKYNGHRPTLSKKASEVWTLRELEPGDVIVANQGKSRVLALGRVVEPGYIWLDDVDEYNHALTVEWDTSYDQQIPRQERWGMVTVTEVSNELYETLLKEGEGEGEGAVPVIRGTPFFETIATALERKGQAVLFGPPGTGKTYQARRFAVWWLTRDGSETLKPTSSSDPFGQLETQLSAGPLTMMTFHPSYSYEDFVEGFRPVDSKEGTVNLKLTNGVFKEICREANGHPDRRYLLLIDEINRANLAKVFGELITLLEKDKRGMTITLPQSKEPFHIPPNVYLLGTMNTVDRSLRHMDAALRRRFRFLEMMPDLEMLRGATVGELRVDDFLENLNRRIIKEEGREKQVGHSYLMIDGAAVSEPEDFADLFRHEIIPLLQEYCYDDFNALARYLGTGLVDKELQTFRDDILEDPEALVQMLAEEFTDREAQ